MKGIWLKISTGQVIKVWSIWKKNGWAIFKFQNLGLKMFIASDFVQLETNTIDIWQTCLFWNTLEFL